MCCCGKEHDNDPLYKRARCFACLNLSGEIIYFVTAWWMALVGVAGLIYMCALAGMASGVSSSSSSSNMWSPDSYDRCYGSCNGAGRCYGKCVPPYTGKSTWITQMKNAGRAQTYGGEFLCDGYTNSHCNPPGSSGGVSCKTSNKLCYSEARRRLSMSPHVSKVFAASTGYSAEEAMTAFSRRLSTSEVSTEDIYKAAKDACNLSGAFAFVVYAGGFFSLMSLIFASINSCLCCSKDCCGGYQGQHKCFGIYSIISSLMQLVSVCILIAITGAVAKTNGFIRQYVKEHLNGRTDPTVHGLYAVETALWVNVVISVFILISRVLTAIFSLIATKEPHSSSAENGQPQVVQMQAPVQVQGVTVASPNQVYIKSADGNTLVPVNAQKV